jgi:hypothetical protein
MQGLKRVLGLPDGDVELALGIEAEGVKAAFGRV